MEESVTITPPTVEPGMTVTLFVSIGQNKQCIDCSQWNRCRSSRSELTKFARAFELDQPPSTVMLTAPSPRMADDDAAALAALASQAPVRLGSSAPALGPRVSLCPHCRLGFGSASLQIHVRRCRALLPDLEAEAAAAEAAEAAAKAAKKPKRKLKVPSLVDLCLRCVTRNFQAVCMDKVMTAPEHEAALIEALPTDLVHRIITNLVFDNKQISEKEGKQRSKVRALQKELHELKTQKSQLEGFRHQATAFRSRLTEQDELIESLRRQLDSSKNELATVQHQNTQLQSQFGAFQKKELRLESRINTLAADNEKLKLDVRAACKKEMEAMKLLASAAKTGKPVDPTKASALQEAPSNQQDQPRSNKRPAAAERRAVVPRPRTEGSKIPYPTHLPATYVAKCIPGTLARE